MKQFDPSLSDVHCGLKLVIVRAVVVEVNKNNESVGGMKKFSNAKLKSGFFKVTRKSRP